MSDVPEFPWLSSEDKPRIQVLREAVTHVLANNLQPHFTDHSVSHSDRLIEILTNLAQIIREDRQLSSEEAFILVASCYLHDVGMQYERAGSTQIIVGQQLATPWEQLNKECRRLLLRKHHHQISAELVAGCTGEGNVLKLPLNMDHRRSCIASICEAHGLDTKSDRYKELSVDVANVRMVLLAGLLRVADILDESLWRANGEKAASLLLDTPSQVHWWRHRYTTDITFDAESRQICLHFMFPTSRRQEYSAIIPCLQMPEITNEISRHKATFVQAGLNWYLTHKVIIQPYDTSQEMPEPVLAAMQRLLHERKVADADRRKLVLVNSFIEARPHIDRRISKLEAKKDAMPPDEYIDGLMDIAMHLRKLGGTQSAWMLLTGEFNRLAASLSADRQAKVALWLIEVILEDGCPREALRIIQVVEGLIQNAARKQKLELMRAQAQVLFCNAAYEQVVGPLKQAIRLSPNKWDLRAMQAELHLLHGQLSSAHYHRSGTTENVANDSRGVLAVARATAMTKGATAAVRQIDRFIRATEKYLSASDRAALQMLKAEVLMLDGQEEKAASHFPSPRADMVELTDQERMVVADNEFILSMSRRQWRQEDFNRLTDHRRLLGVQLWNPEAVVAADEAAAAGRHWDALPRYWWEFVQTYRLRCWRSHKWAASRMAKERLTLGQLVEAVHYCLLSEDKKLAELIGERLLTIEDSDQIAKTVDRLLSHSALLRHASVTCQILAAAAEVIPDDQVREVLEWVLPRCQAVPEFGPRSILFEQSWKLVELLALRAEPKTVCQVVQIAVDHPVWAHQHLARQHLIRTVNVCAGLMPASDLAELADRTLPLAGESKFDVDYAATLNLLCHIAERGGKKVRNLIGKALFPKGASPAHPYLAQISHIFDERQAGIQNLPEVTAETARNIRLWVQRVAPESEPKKVNCTFGTFSSVHGDTRIVVQMAAGADLDAAIQHAQYLPQKSISQLLAAMIAMMKDRDNHLGNKSILVKAIEGFSPYLTQGMCQRAWVPLSSLASGDMGKGGHTAADESRNPLNPFKFNDVSPVALSGLALRALAAVERDHPGVYGAKVVRLIEQGLLDETGETRAWAFAAVARLPEPSNLAINGVLLGTRDSNAEAAKSAFVTLQTAVVQHLKAHHWELLVHSAQLAATASDVGIRRAVARLVSTKVKMPQTARPAWRRIRQKLSKDRCWSVRNACVS